MKKLKTLLIMLISAGVVGAAYFVWAQTVADTYDNDSKIADSWNISTSTAGQIELLAKTCEATEWFCTASTTCANYLGDGDYIIVKQGDAPGSLAWKSANTACDQPQCGINGGQNGDNLKADNTLSFSAYPARAYCQSIGGRLPTIDELDCIYDNSGGRGTNVFGSFVAGYYWSSTEYSATGAWYQNFPGGDQGSSGKATTNYVRCVKGW